MNNKELTRARISYITNTSTSQEKTNVYKHGRIKFLPAEDDNWGEKDVLDITWDRIHSRIHIWEDRSKWNRSVALMLDWLNEALFKEPSER